MKLWLFFQTFYEYLHAHKYLKQWDNCNFLVKTLNWGSLGGSAD